jgi:hypothetical protein
MSLFYEHQDGILCRKHAINAYFGYEKITVSDFYKFQDIYDIEYKKKFNIDISCKDFDVISSDQKNLVSYILKEFNVYTKYYSLNELFQKDINCIINTLAGNFFFIYNESHIYGASINNAKWYTVNSIGGVNIMDINCLTSQKNIGFIVPLDHKKEFYKNLLTIKSLFGINNTIPHIKDFLVQNHKNKLILGDIEIPLSICIDILEYQMQLNYKKKYINNEIFEPIHIKIIKYNEFLTKFTNGRYNDITLILEYLPTIIFELINLKDKY